MKKYLTKSEETYAGRMLNT